MNKNSQALKKHVGRKAGLSFNAKGIYLFVVMALMAIVLQSLNVQAKSLLRAKKTLKLLQSPSSLINLRSKRDTFPNYYDENDDILPDLPAGWQTPTLGDQISEQAKQVAQSFQNMWQSLTDSVHHCVDALRAMFGEPLGDEELTPEQEEEIMANLEAKYRLQHERENEI